MKRFHLKLWLPAILFYIFITVLSSISGNMIDDRFRQPFPHFDKLVHFFLYAFLGVIVARALSWEEYRHHLKKRWYLYFAVLIPLISMADEIHQFFVAARSMSIIDWGADIGGALAGGLFYVYVLRRGRRHDRQLTELEQIDFNVQGLIFILFYYVVLLSLLIFDYRQLLVLSPWLSDFVVPFVEFSILGLFVYRFFRYRFSDARSMSLIGFMLSGLGFIGLAFGLEWSLKGKSFEIFAFLAAFLGFVFGIALYYGQHVVQNFRQTISRDSSYKRSTVQRLYYFSPPVFLGAILYSAILLYAFSFWFVILYSTAYFFFGLLFFRAVMWESHWHEKRLGRWILFTAVLVIIAFAFIPKIMTYGESFFVWLNVGLGSLAFLVYWGGLHALKRVGRKHNEGPCQFKV